MEKFSSLYKTLGLSLSVFICISALFSCAKKETPLSSEPETMTPSGKLSDLVYNPVREDGTIDSSFLPIITWEDTVYDFGVIYEGDVVNREFKFKNTGTAPLLINNASSTCGCTIPEWPTKPIPPGQEGTIKVKFDSKNKPGAQSKEVTIFANTFPSQRIITIKGIVEKPN